MAHRNLVLRPHPAVGQTDTAERLSARLLAEPGVLAVRIDTLPLCVCLRYDADITNEATLRARVLYAGVDTAGSESALRMQVRLGSLLPRAALALASVL